MVGAMMDVSERKEAEAALRHSEDQLRQAMKMEAVGRLAEEPTTSTTFSPRYSDTPIWR
jgi:phosphoglycerate-specific signal transduction histidine kinase